MLRTLVSTGCAVGLGQRDLVFYGSENSILYPITVEISYRKFSKLTPCTVTYTSDTGAPTTLLLSDQSFAKRAFWKLRGVLAEWAHLRASEFYESVLEAHMTRNGSLQVEWESRQAVQRGKPGSLGDEASHRRLDLEMPV